MLHIPDAAAAAGRGCGVSTSLEQTSLSPLCVIFEVFS